MNVRGRSFQYVYDDISIMGGFGLLLTWGIRRKCADSFRGSAVCFRNCTDCFRKCADCFLFIFVLAMKYNFDKVVDGAVDSVGEPYDYASIMHYPFNAFSKDWNKDTIVPKRPLNGKTPYVKLTDSDARQANILYKCSGNVLCCVMSCRQTDRQTAICNTH